MIPRISSSRFRKAILWLALAVPGLHGAPAAPGAALAMRLLKTNCVSCHNEDKRKGGLSLTSRDLMMKGGDEGVVVLEGKPEESILIKSLAAGADPHMPPKKQLTAAQITLLTEWLRGGAPWDANVLAGEPSEPRPVSLTPLPASWRPVLAMALSPDGTRLAAGCRNEVAVFDVTPAALTFRARASAHLEAVQSIEWTPDGKSLISGAFRRVVIWSADSLTQRREITTGLTDRITALRVLPDGSRALLADGQVTENGIVRVLDLTSGQIERSWRAHEDTIFAMALTADGKTLATAGGDRFVRMWDVATGTESAKLEAHTTQVLSLAFNPDSTQLVTGGADRSLKVWDVKTRENTIALANKTTAFNALTWSAGGPAIFAVTDDGALLRYTDMKAHTGAQSSETGNERQLGKAESALCCLTATGNGERIFAGSSEGRILGWDKEGKLLDNIDVTAAMPAVANAAPAPENPGAVTPAAVKQVSFVRDVLPVLGKAGCNAGACHAKADGQNGFRLSVFSFDPRADYHSMVTAARGRRVFPSDPPESLLLLKATQSMPHEGGERFARNSEAWRTLAEWIGSGMTYSYDGAPALAGVEVEPKERPYHKGESQHLKVSARYSDGSVRDVTDLATFSSNDKQIVNVSEDGTLAVEQASGQAVVVARYMGMVAASRVLVPTDKLLAEDAYNGLPVNNFIDEKAYARFRQLGLLPSAPCSDAEFLRRASLDAIGLLPAVEEARAFIAESDPQKRARAIDRLLQHPAYADHWAAKWADLLRPNPDRVGVKSVYVLDQWLRESFRQNKPYDQFVREILLTQGNTHRYGPAVIYRDRREPAELTTMFSQLFLGVRLDCARCHHHPNEKWSQEDFYRMAAFFAPLQPKGGGISAPISGGNETFFVIAGGTIKHPVTGEIMKPQPPDGPPAAVAEKADPRLALADWMTNPANPLFAKAVVNRIWSHYFGKGIVDPVDDFRLSNPASNPELLDALAQELVRSRFDLKALMRAIMTSHLYQLSSEPNESNTADTRNFARSYRRRLSAESMADAITDITGLPTKYPGLPEGSRAVHAWTYKVDSRTMDAFGRPNSSSDCPCERNLKPAIGQALHLMNSNELHAKLTSTDARSRVQRLATGGASPRDIVTELYFACYSRLPSDDEVQIATAAFSDDPAARRRAIEDVLWALLNSAEFVFNH